MEGYHKIETLLDRDEKFKVIKWKWRLPEFEYLKDNLWLWTEKIDGTNIRVMWNGQTVTFGGKTNNAQISTFLLLKLQELFPVSKFAELYPDNPMCLYGEGYGAKIQKGGGNYISNGCDFILFDVKVGDWWLERENIEDIAGKLGIKVVPVIGKGNLIDAINQTEKGHYSTFGKFIAEGIVVRPLITLFTRKGERLLGKIKTKDWGH